MAAAWVGYGAVLIPRTTEEAGAVAPGRLHGGGLPALRRADELWFWPFGAGTTTTFSFQPGAPLGHNLARFLAFDVTTSLGLRHPPGRAQRRLILAVGRPVVAALRRASHKAAFGAASGTPPTGSTPAGAGPNTTAASPMTTRAPAGRFVDARAADPEAGRPVPQGRAAPPSAL